MGFSHTMVTGHRRRRAVRASAIAAALLAALTACHTFESTEPAQPPPPKIIERPPPPPPPLPTTMEKLPPPAADGVVPAYDEQQARALRGGPPPPPPGPDVRRVALLVPLSGPLSQIGTAMLNAAMMAVFETAGANLEVLPYNTAGGDGRAVRAAQTALADGCSLFLGPLLATDVQAVVPVAEAAGVAVVAFSSDRKVAGETAFVMGFTPETEVERIIGHAAAIGRTRIAVLAPADAYGATVIGAARAAATAADAKVIAAETYPADTADFAAVLKRLPGMEAWSQRPSGADAGAPMAAAAALPFDALLIGDGGARLRQIGATLATVGLTPPAVQVFGTGAWDEPGLDAVPGLVGARYAAPDPSYRVDFERAFRTTFGSRPHRLATLAYDATAMAALLARDVGKRPFRRAALADTHGFLGRDGLFRLRADGSVDRSLAVIEVGTGGTAVVDPPLTRFTGS